MISHSTPPKSDRSRTRSRLVVLGPLPSIQKRKIGSSSPPSTTTATIPGSIVVAYPPGNRISLLPSLNVILPSIRFNPHRIAFPVSSPLRPLEFDSPLRPPLDASFTSNSPRSSPNLLRLNLATKFILVLSAIPFCCHLATVDRSTPPPLLSLLFAHPNPLPPARRLP
ncbi:hypothetical protein PGT21_024279 [Puccinia graminis f. sp. tritici]|uniref:Uncharacterized protein n=1 Tax=Puccinia graminis f. sp. tritici TaxID=56615 RepID=A0A5B0NP95_PUCGR|nr:hypothetical protein PGT21_024279 [Puccinia graminis f. sp. tritici]